MKHEMHEMIEFPAAPNLVYIKAERAAAASPLTMLTGVEITSAHGQAITNNTSA